MATLDPLAVHDTFDRGGYPATLDGSTSTSGHTWDANPDLEVDELAGESYAYGKSGPGAFYSPIGVIDHGTADGILCGVADQRELLSHSLVFRYVDDDNFNEMHSFS